MSNNSERFWIGFLFFWRAFLMTMLLLIGSGFISGCSGGGDEGTNCGMTDNCGPDAGPADDADTMPDSPKDACTDYRWMAEKPWDCHGNWDNGDFVCEKMELELVSDGGRDGCFIQCGEYLEFKHWDSGLAISRTPPPPTLDYTSGNWKIHCTQRQ